MIAMAERFLRQKFESPLVSVTLAVLALLVAAPPALSNGPARLVALLLIASGAVSRDASSGALQMILARPISRTEYLGGRLLGVMAAYAIFLAAAAVFALLLSLQFGGTATLLSAALPRALLGALLDGLQVAVFLLLLSTLLPSFGDALGYLFLWIAFSAAAGFGTALGRESLAKAARTVQANLLPDVRWDAVLAGRNLPSEALGRWVLAVTLCFVLAAVVLARREFAYGQD
jgi:ABC-type transport system involved in multi-copper enzyme maturation permease subunit